MAPIPRIAAKHFEGDYSDKLHPLCTRHIEVDDILTKTSTKSFYTAHFSGTDIGPPGIGPVVRSACDEESIQKYGLREWTFDAKILVDGDTIDAGDEIHDGVWHKRQAARERPARR